LGPPRASMQQRGEAAAAATMILIVSGAVHAPPQRPGRPVCSSPAARWAPGHKAGWCWARQRVSRPPLSALLFAHVPSWSTEPDGSPRSDLGDSCAYACLFSSTSSIKGSSQSRNVLGWGLGLQVCCGAVPPDGPSATLTGLCQVITEYQRAATGLREEQASALYKFSRQGGPDVACPGGGGVERRQLRAARSSTSHRQRAATRPSRRTRRKCSARPPCQLPRLRRCRKSQLWEHRVAGSGGQR
jgi:hypothetical protein